MILKKIDIYNFRQFYGKYSLSFETDESKKVVLVRGQNGSGKTTLLNAFWWCFYGETTDKFKRPENIISFKALASKKINEEISCSVAVAFEHNKYEYIIKRYLEGTVGKELKFQVRFRKPKVEIKMKNRETGEMRSEDIGNPENMIKAILPRELAPYFFFDGENLQHMTEQKNNDDIAKAIRLLTGAAIFKRAEEDLIGRGSGKGDVRKYFQRDRKLYGDEETKKIESNRERASQERSKLEDELGRKEKEVQKSQIRLAEVDEKLRNNETTKESQRNLEWVRKQQKNCEDRLVEIRTQKKQLVSEKACFFLLLGIMEDVKSYIQESKKAGLIPQGFRKAWIDKLLNNGECICGKNLDEGSEKYKRVLNLKNEGEYDDVDEEIADLNGRIETYMKDAKNFELELIDVLAKEREHYTDGKSLKEKEDKFLVQLGEEAGRSGEENLKNKKIEIEKERNNLLEEIGGLKQKIVNVGKAIEEFDKNLKMQRGLDEKANLATKRIDAVDRIGEICRDLAKYRELKIWKDLQRRIQNVFGDISIRPFKVELSPPNSTPPYIFSIWNEMGEKSVEVGESTGESQMLSLSFIGCLLNLAKKLPNSSIVQNYGLDFGGGIFPLVIDSPFGQIDNHYRPQIIEAARKLAPQLILFVSNSQWSDEIEGKIRPYVAEEYLIKYRKPSEKWNDSDDVHDYSIEIFGEKHLFVEKTEERYEFSEIERV